VRVIDAEGNNVGITPLSKAINLAKEAGLDLMEVSSGATPPVCRIGDYNKYLYDQKAKLKKNKAKKNELKEFQLSPKIAEGDLKMRVDRGREFLKEGNMVKYTVKFKGRERLHPELGEMKLKIVEAELAEVSSMEAAPKRFGNAISMTLAPKKAK